MGMTLNSKSKIHAFLSKNYPYGAFNTRHNQLKVFVDRKNKNKLAQKFKVEINLQKDGAEVVDFKADTTVSPYEFKFILKDPFEVSPNSLIYKNIISQYKFLTPFKTRSGEFEFYINKKAKNVVLNKFYAKGKVTKDGKKAMELL